MSIKSLMNYTFVSKYARWDEQKKRRETWAESVDRVRQMMIDKYASDDSNPEIIKAINKAYDDMKETYLEFAETGQEGSYLWEGIVTVWTEPPYELTLRQSENLHTMCKNRFR